MTKLSRLASFLKVRVRKRLGKRRLIRRIKERKERETSK
jgi:hypothetical protein